MEKSGAEQFVRDIKKKRLKKSTCVITQIQGVGSQKYSVEFVKKGY